MNNAVFGRSMGNVWKHRIYELSGCGVEFRCCHCLVSKPNCHTGKFFTETFAIEIRKTETLIKKPIYLGLSILKLSKTVVY